MLETARSDRTETAYVDTLWEDLSQNEYDTLNQTMQSEQEVAPQDSRMTKYLWGDKKS
jgi:hypothetical protein